MKRAVFLLVVACGGTTRQETVTTIAPLDQQACPHGSVFNGVSCAPLLSHVSWQGVPCAQATVQRTAPAQLTVQPPAGQATSHALEP